MPARHSGDLRAGQPTGADRRDLLVGREQGRVVVLEAGDRRVGAGERLDDRHVPQQLGRGRRRVAVRRPRLLLGGAQGLALLDRDDRQQGDHCAADHGQQRVDDARPHRQHGHQCEELGGQGAGDRDEGIDDARGVRGQP